MDAIPSIDLATGASIPLLGLGTYRLSSTDVTRVMHQALELGYRHFDLAQIYENQQEIGQALREVPRSDLYLVSKIWLGDHTAGRVALATDRILDELKVDYLDLLLIHWPDRSVPFGETLKAMARQVEEGKTISVGVSNFTIHHLEQALVEANRIGLPLAVNQVELHPGFGQEQLCAFCRDHNIAVVAYSPLGKGEIFKNAVLKTIGEKKGKTEAQIALRWLIERGIVVIPKGVSYDHLKENRALFGWSLTKKEILQIESLEAGERLVCPSYADFE